MPRKFRGLFLSADCKSVAHTNKERLVGQVVRVFQSSLGGIMFINDTRQLRCGECGSTKVRITWVDCVKFAKCKKCGHKKIVEIAIKPKILPYEHDKVWRQFENNYRDF